MRNSSFLNFDNCILSNEIWSDFINKIGISKARLAVRQALDLQDMQGSSSTLPVLFLETCGSALISSEAIRIYIGLRCEEKGMLLLYSAKLKAIQLLSGK